jgi:peptidoglycan/LPS O-acetylase OafA/YrhL
MFTITNLHELSRIILFKENSLNTFRLLAALQVLWGHTLWHLQLERIPIIGDFIDFFIGVPVFFTLSGFLIWQSISRSQTFGAYAKKRFWRIYPELWLAVAVEIVVMLLLYHEPINYPQLGLFTVGQATIFQFWTPDCLRGYGCGCPNGALWTITILIQFYFCAYFIYKWLKGRQSWMWWAVILMAVVIGWLTPCVKAFLPETIAKLYGVSLMPYLWMFLMAAFASEKREIVIPFLKRYWWVIIALLILKRYVLHWDVLMSSYALFDTIMLFTGIVGFAYAVPQVNIKTDISYGIYIYHMTVVNALIAFGCTGQSWTIWGVIGVTCILAWISTVTIGRFAIRMKKQSVVQSEC